MGNLEARTPCVARGGSYVITTVHKEKYLSIHFNKYFSPLCRLQASLYEQGSRVLSSGSLINVQALLVMFPFHLQTEDRFN